MVRIGAATALWAYAVWLWPAEVSVLGLEALSADQASLIAASCVAFVVGSRFALSRLSDSRAFRRAVGVGRRRSVLPTPVRLVLHSAATASGEPDRTRTVTRAPAPDRYGERSPSRPQMSRGPRVGRTADV